MPVTRFNNRLVTITDDPQYVYSDALRKRGITNVVNYTTPNLAYPSPDEIENLTEETVIWGVGSKYFKLAKEYYDDEQYWWIIAWYNLKPLETDNKLGDIIYIPLPLEEILSNFELI